MNNSQAVGKLSLENAVKVDYTPQLRSKEGELISIIDSLQRVQSTKEWCTLKEKVFDNLVVSLERELATEAKKENPDTLKLNRLAGQLKWAEKYSDLTKLEDSFRLELTHVRIKLYGKTK